MRAAKRYLYLTDTEWRIILLAPNELRSKLIAPGQIHRSAAQISCRNGLPH